MLRILEVGIGLALVFTLVALICSIINEWISAMVEKRGNLLWEGIENLVGAELRGRLDQDGLRPAAADPRHRGLPGHRARERQRVVERVALRGVGADADPAEGAAADRRVDREEGDRPAEVETPDLVVAIDREATAHRVAQQAEAPSRGDFGSSMS